MHVSWRSWPVCFFAVLVLISGCKGDGGGHGLEAFQLEGLDGARFHIGDYRGKIVVLVFWSVYCVPCHRQLSAMARDNMIHNPLVKIVSICVDPRDRALVEQGAQMFAHRIPVLLDYNSAMKKKLRIKTEPTTLIVDGKGAEVARMIGYDNSTLSRISRAVAVIGQKSTK